VKVLYRVSVCKVPIDVCAIQVYKFTVYKSRCSLVDEITYL